LKQIPQDQRGATFGTLSAFYDLFVGLSSFAAGTVARHFGYSAAFVMAAAALIAAAGAGRYVFHERSGVAKPQPVTEAA
jgi:hypothetical protein